MRPRTLDEFVGQQQVVGPNTPLRRALESGHPHSMVLWGPPGSGKTTLARMLADLTEAQFLSLSAVLAGVKDIRHAVDKALTYRAEKGRETILFIDEVHRFNKAQQDAFLPFVEDGTLIFVGSTTENPSFELNGALLSRTRLYVLKPLAPQDVRAVIDRALADPARGVGRHHVEMAPDLRDLLAQSVDGDVRCALNVLEIAVDTAEREGARRAITRDLLSQTLSSGAARRFDKKGDAFYDQISALHKSVRGSDPNASLYWLARMLDGGCDPLYLARRLVRIASEDIGNADPRALRAALDAWDVQIRLGSPEGELALAQATVYLACAAKSNAVYRAFHAAMDDVRAGGTLDVPAQLRNAPTAVMKALGHGEGYRYAHDEPDGYAAGESYFPDDMEPREYYQPAPRGLEVRIGEKLAHLRALDRQYVAENKGKK